MTDATTDTPTNTDSEGAVPANPTSADLVEAPETPTAETIDSLPEFAQKIITDLRGENGDHRVKNRDLQALAESQAKQIAELTEKHGELETAATEAKATLTLADERVKGLEADLEAERFGRFKDREALTRGVPLEIAEKLSANSREAFTQLLDLYQADIEKKTKAQRPAFDPAQLTSPKTAGGREEAVSSFFNALD